MQLLSNRSTFFFQKVDLYVYELIEETMKERDEGEWKSGYFSDTFACQGIVLTCVAMHIVVVLE